MKRELWIEPNLSIIALESVYIWILHSGRRVTTIVITAISLAFVNEIYFTVTVD